MHSLCSKTVVKSVLFPGVEYTIRTLNVVQRAKRDAKVATQRAEYARLTAERQSALAKLIGVGGTDEERTAKYDALAATDRAKDQTLFEAIERILQEYLVPANIEAALISVSGYEIDGAAPDWKLLIEHAPDTLLAEVHRACTTGSCLTGDEAKN
jgi:hypothetical protein